MKTSSKSQDKCQVKLSVTLEADEMNAIVKDVEKVFLREAQLPGFRKGKVPLQIIRKEFADGLKQEIQRAMFQKNYPEAIKAEAIEEVALANVEDLKYDEKGGSFVAIVETKPKFKLPTYKGLKIEFKDAKVDDAAVADQLERLRAVYAKYEDACTSAPYSFLTPLTTATSPCTVMSAPIRRKSGTCLKRVSKMFSMMIPVPSEIASKAIIYLLHFYTISKIYILLFCNTALYNHH